MAVPEKARLELLYDDPAHSAADYIPPRTDICTAVFKAASLTLAKRWNDGCLLSDGWINKM